MLFKPKTNRDDFEREVRLEVAYMRDLHGNHAYLVAKERAQRPRLGGPRKRVIEEAARRLSAEHKAVGNKTVGNKAGPVAAGH